MVLQYENFIRKFRQDMRPYWVLYEGRSTKGKLAKSNYELENMEESLSYLENTIGYYEKGIFTIVTKASVNGKNNYVVSFQKGEVSNNQFHSGPQGFRQYGMPTFMDMYGLTDQLRARINQLEVENATLKIEKKQLEKEIEEAGVGSTLDTFLGSLAENMPTILPSIMGSQQPNAPAPPVPNSGIGSTQPKQKEDNGTFSYDRAIQCMMHMQKLYPQHRVDLMMLKLVNWMSTNKEMADPFINNLMNPDGQQG